MENTDNTMQEMQQQLQQLKSKLENQKIVNEKILRKSCSQSMNRLKLKSNLPILLGVAAILMTPSFLTLGMSMYTVVFTWVLMLICIVATVITNRHIPRIDSDVVTAAEELGKYKKIHAEWIKFGLPMAAVWVGLMIIDAVKGAGTQWTDTIPMMSGLLVGAILGAVLGLKLRRDQMEAADDLLAQIKDLRQGESA